MFSIPFAAIGLFFKDNIKWVAIGLMAIVIAFGAWRYTRMVQENATLKFNNQQLESLVDDRDRLLKAERDLNAITNQIVEQQAQDIWNLQSDLQSLTSQLPEDNKDLAPESIRETLRRIRGKL